MEKKAKESKKKNKTTLNPAKPGNTHTHKQTKTEQSQGVCGNTNQ